MSITNLAQDDRDVPHLLLVLHFVKYVYQIEKLCPKLMTYVFHILFIFLSGDKFFKYIMK